MAVSKTRAKLVDVARQLFAKNGVDDTTMNDIAVASKKGRRTLYTYFKSKEDIYMAVVESELEMLSGAMEKVAEQDIAPDTKILRLIETHLDSIKMVVFRNGTLRAGFFRDIWRVEAVRKNFDRTETKLFRQVLTEGKEKGIFDIDNVNIVADIVHYCVKGIEAPYIRGQIGEELDAKRRTRIRTTTKYRSEQRKSFQETGRTSLSFKSLLVYTLGLRMQYRGGYTKRNVP